MSRGSQSFKTWQSRHLHNINIWMCKHNRYHTIITGYIQSPPPIFSPLFITLSALFNGYCPFLISHVQYVRSMIQYAPSTSVIFVDYPDLCVLLIFGLVTFIFSILIWLTRDAMCLSLQSLLSQIYYIFQQSS